MRTWLVLAALAVAAGVVVAVVMLRDDTRVDVEPRRDAASAHDPLVEEFRAMERDTIAAYTAARREQRDNRIDELALADAVEREALAPWRAMRERVDAAAIPTGRQPLYATLRRYLAARQIAWESYVAALRADSDAAARPHYDVHYQKNAEAQDAARELGAMFGSR